MVLRDRMMCLANRNEFANHLDIDHAVRNFQIVIFQCFECSVIEVQRKEFGKNFLSLNHASPRAKSMHRS